MLNQGQGTYPQLAGSFYNSQQMMPHDNGRNAHQVPTFFGGLQNMISASTAMTNYQGIPLSQNILNTQALAARQYSDSLAHTVGGLSTAAGMTSLVGGLSLAGLGAAKYTAASPGLGGLLTRGAALVGGGIMGAGLTGVGLAGMAITHGYNKRMSAIEDMRNALEGNRFGYGLADPVTGNLSNTAALSLSRNIEYAAAGTGFKANDLKKVMGQASGLGMLSGMQSLSDVTKKVTDLAEASREIVMLGEGISMTDAMKLQKLTQDMGISTNKFRGMNIGKNLVMAARAANMSADQAAQLGGQGAMTFQQAGLGAASGMNAAFFTNTAAAGLVGAGAFSSRKLAALGGQQGLAQNLLMGQASTMARMKDILVMGSVKLGSDGEFRIDRDMLDRYVRGDVSAKDLIERGKNIGKGMSKGQRARLLEGLQYAMPGLGEQMSDMLNSEEMMAIQGREILELRRKNPGLSMRRAAQAYFGDSAQAEAFLGYSQNFRAARAEATRQRNIADTEQRLKYAGMAKSSSGLAQFGRGITRGISGAIDFVVDPFTGFGESMADVIAAYQDRENRALSQIMGIGGYTGGDLGTNAQLYYRGLTGQAVSGRRLLRSSLQDQGPRGRTGSILARARALAGSGNALGNRMLMSELGLDSGLNVIGGLGLSQALTEAQEGEYWFHRKLGDYTGIDFHSQSSISQQLIQGATIAEQALEMGRVMQNTEYSGMDPGMRAAYRLVLNRLRDVGSAAARGDKKNVADISINRLRGILEGAGSNGRVATLSQSQKDAAIAAAMRTATTMGGDTSKGINDLLTKQAGVAKFFTNIQDTTTTIDQLSLRGGTTIKGRGLSAAIAQSRIDKGDISKLIETLASGGGEIMAEGAGINSTQAILRVSGIDPDKYATGDLAGIHRLINVLKRSTATTASKKSASLLNFIESQAGGAIHHFGITDDLGDHAIMARNRELRAIDDEITRNLGGGRGLREGLLSQLGISRQIRQGQVTKEHIAEYLQGSTQLSDVEKREALIKLIPKQVMDIIDKQAQTQEKYVKKGSGAKVRQEMIENRLKSMGITEAQKEVIYEQARQEKISKELQSGNKKYEEEARAYLNKQISKSEQGATLFEEGASLSEVLQGLAKSKGDKKAYAKLMQGSVGADLEMEFQDMKARIRDTQDPVKKQQLRGGMMDMIIEKARSASVALPGQQKSKSLDQILENISKGIDDFRGAMQTIARIKISGETAEVNLPAPGASNGK